MLRCALSNTCWVVEGELQLKEEGRDASSRLHWPAAAVEEWSRARLGIFLLLICPPASLRFIFHAMSALSLRSDIKK